MNSLRISLALSMFLLVTLFTPNLFASGDGSNLLLEKSFQTGSNAVLKLNVYTGNVKINTWNKNAVEIKIYGTNDAENCLDFDVIIGKFNINIKASKKEGVDLAKDLGLRYEITVPRDYGVSVKDSKGNVTVDSKITPAIIGS